MSRPSRSSRRRVSWNDRFERSPGRLQGCRMTKPKISGRSKVEAMRRRDHDPASRPSVMRRFTRGRFCLQFFAMDRLFAIHANQLQQNADNKGRVLGFAVETPFRRSPRRQSVVSFPPKGNAKETATQSSASRRRHSGLRIKRACEAAGNVWREFIPFRGMALPAAEITGKDNEPQREPCQA